MMLILVVTDLLSTNKCKNTFYELNITIDISNLYDFPREIEYCHTKNIFCVYFFLLLPQKSNFRNIKQDLSSEKVLSY